MSHETCPYSGMPDQAYWKRVVAGVDPGVVDPVGTPPFGLSKSDRVATAGSCFAQHIARYLGNAGLAPYITEPAPVMADAATAQEFQYGTYSARYGNLYTARQLLQLFKRAFDGAEPVDEAWERDGRYFDPYRPSVQPDGFRSLAELRADRRQHLAAVRRMFTGLDVFVFTLGLTESWFNRTDGAVYPVCPGCGWGTFDPVRHGFINFGVNDIVADLGEFLARLRAVNPASRVILTVSPVPLVATAEKRHVLQSTTLSKSVLRVAADMIASTHERVAYFPSYEIITGAFSRGRYFAEDLRSVLPTGVDHVMRTFFNAFLPGVEMRRESAEVPAASPRQERGTVAVSSQDQAFTRVADLICEEEQLDGRTDD